MKTCGHCNIEFKPRLEDERIGCTTLEYLGNKGLIMYKIMWFCNKCFYDHVRLKWLRW